MAKGRSLAGVDCWGLVRLFYQNELGIQLPSYDTDYLTSAHRESVAGAIVKFLPDAGWARVEDGRQGDLVIFKIFGLPTHVGILLNKDDFLHAFAGCDSCIERLSAITWSRRIHGIFRWQTT